MSERFHYHKSAIRQSKCVAPPPDYEPAMPSVQFPEISIAPDEADRSPSVRSDWWSPPRIDGALEQPPAPGVEPSSGANPNWFNQTLEIPYPPAPPTPTSSGGSGPSTGLDSAAETLLRAAEKFDGVFNGRIRLAVVDVHG